jgi:hypothetical protein
MNHRIIFRAKDVISTHVNDIGVTVSLSTYDGFGHQVENLIHTACLMAEISDPQEKARQISDILLAGQPSYQIERIEK